MAELRRLVLDTLKPHEPSIVALAKALSDLDGVNAVNISIYEIDQKVENAKITLEGTALDYPAVLAVVGDLGGTVHSVDEVVAGKAIIDDAATLQD